MKVDAGDQPELNALIAKVREIVIESEGVLAAHSAQSRIDAEMRSRAINLIQESYALLEEIEAEQRRLRPSQ